VFEILIKISIKHKKKLEKRYKTKQKHQKSFIISFFSLIFIIRKYFRASKIILYNRDRRKKFTPTHIRRNLLELSNLSITSRRSEGKMECEGEEKSIIMGWNE
jgi:hypothetical protein